MRPALFVLCVALIGCGDDTGRDDPPVIDSELDVHTDEDTPASLTIRAHDPDGLAVTIAVSTAPAHGTATVAGDKLTYTPAANYFGADTLVVTVSDGVMSTDGEVSITISSVNDLPIGMPDSFETPEDTPKQIETNRLLANDSDADGGPLVVAGVGNASGGTVTFNGFTTVVFTPLANTSGAASFTYTLTDGTVRVDVPVSVTVTAVNDPPVAVDDSATTPEEIPIMIATAVLAGNDTDADGQTPTITAVDNATGGTAALAGTIVTFSPATDFNGAGGFDYTISDGTATDVGHVTITVTPVEDPPVAVDDQGLTTPIATPLPIPAATLLANDTDADPGDTLAVTAVGAPAHGAVGLAGDTITFTPEAGYVGIATFEYTVGDGVQTDTGLVSITVTPACGDGLVSTGEDCDDGALVAGDGCSATCTTELGWSCTGAPSTCTPVCGDGHVVGTEVCDDGNPDDTDGCDAQCHPAVVCNASAFPGADAFAVIAGPGTCYASWSDDPLAFSDAEAACVAAGGHLATPATAAEQSAAAAAHVAGQTEYIGGVDDANDTDAVFAWIDGEPWGATSFASGQPDDGGASGDGECLAMTDPGAWDDVSCTAAGAATGRICQFALDACGDGVVQAVRGEECDDGNATPGDGCDPTCHIETLFFSKYVEGSSNNKVLEITNPFTAAYDLAAHTCTLRNYSNGSATASSSLALTGTIAVGDVYVVCHTSVNATLAPLCDQLNGGMMGFNGDDAVTLECDGAVVDSIGQQGVDPGTEWGTGLSSTADNTLVHRCTAGAHGDRDPADAYDPAALFVGFATDTFTAIGSPSCAP